MSSWRCAIAQQGESLLPRCSHGASAAAFPLTVQTGPSQRRPASRRVCPPPTLVVSSGIRSHGLRTPGNLWRPAPRDGTIDRDCIAPTRSAPIATCELAHPTGERFDQRSHSHLSVPRRIAAVSAAVTSTSFAGTMNSSLTDWPSGFRYSLQHGPWTSRFGATSPNSFRQDTADRFQPLSGVTLGI